MSACCKCAFDPEAQIAATYSFLVERDAPSLNARLHNTKKGGYAYRAERDAWCWLLRAARINNRIPIGDTKRRVTITRVFSGRQQKRDRDNLAGGMKAIVDALVLERLIVDDDEKHVEIHYAQQWGSPRGLLFQLEVFA